MEKIKVGVIGAGSISQEHIRSYLNNPGVGCTPFATSMKRP